MKGNCELCGHHRTLKRNRKIKKLICWMCYRKRFQPRRKCVYCGKRRIAQTQTKKGGSVCSTCYPKLGAKKEKCIHCPPGTRAKFVHYRTPEDGPVCGRCYQKRYRPLILCSK